jgi:hypothetical protein
MADALRELIIKVTRDDAEAKAKAAAFWAAELEGQRKAAAAAKSTEATVVAAEKAKATAAKSTEKAKSDAAQYAAKIIKDAQKSVADQAASIRKADRAAQKELAEEAKATAEVRKKAAKAILDSVREQVAESKRIEKEAFAEGRRLAAEAKRAQRESDRESVAASRRLTAEAQRRWREEKRSFDGTVGLAKGWTAALTRAYTAAGLVARSTFAAVEQSIRESTQHLQELVRIGEEARNKDREVAALTGNAPTVLFSAKQAGEAAQAGVSPEDWRQGQLAFQAQAGALIGDDPKLHKISQDRATDLQQRVASFSASQGIPIEEPMRLMGAILAKAPENATNADLMTSFGKVFKGLQMAPGKTGPLVGQITKVIQEEVSDGGDIKSVEEAVPLIRAMAERDPDEAATYGRSLLRGLRKIRADPAKMQALGIKKDMSFREQVAAVGKAAEASGDEGQFLSEYFTDIREFGGIRTALSAGIRGQGFARVDAEMAGVTDDTINADIAAYKSSEEGAKQIQESSIQRAQLEAGSRGVSLAAIRRRAQETIISSRVKDTPELPWDGLSTLIKQGMGAGNRAEQLETQLIGAELAQRLGGTERGRRWMEEHKVAPGSHSMYSNGLELGGSFTPEAVLQAAAQALEDIRAGARDFKEAAADQRAAAQAVKPRVPPAPAPAPARIGNPP